MSRRYMISDNEHNPIAQAVLDSEPGLEPLHLLVQDGRAELVASQGDICLLGMGEEDVAFRGRVSFRYGDCVVVAPGEKLDASARRNLRVPIEFKSFFYPVTGEWRGQRTLVSKDLSCGGIAFHTTQPLEPGEIVQVVVAPMKHPLIVSAHILRPLPSDGGVGCLYASKFVDLCSDEDAAIQEAVYSIQLKNNPR